MSCQVCNEVYSVEQAQSRHNHASASATQLCLQALRTPSVSVHVEPYNEIETKDTTHI